MRVNGLYGHVRSNDVRSLALFAGFVAAFHLLAMLALVVPLAMYDPDHAPIYGWTGYLLRWVPVVTVIGAILFAVQMAWHVRTVRRRTDFRFVDDQDEPRLCRIVEPLAIAAGLPTPYVGVIDSPALNAFACGIRQKDAVLVFTRGLIDALDDDELAAVAAHEIVHIVNGDIRLIAATNVCLDTLKLLQPRPSTQRKKRIQAACTIPILAFQLPVMVVLVLVTMFLRRLAVEGSHLTRLLIASARELIADAESVRLTQNPAALVSALGRIEGRSVIPGLAAGQDAMMIDGAHEGAFATHPTIAERVAAIVSVTGSMALIAPARRDTRPAACAGDGFGRRSAVEPEYLRSARQGVNAALARVSSGNEFNRLGLTREMSVGAVAAVGVFLWVHSADLRNPAALVEAFDPAPMRTLLALGREQAQCQMQGMGGLIRGAAKPLDCSELFKTLGEHSGDDGLIGKIARSMTEAPEGMYVERPGTFTNVPPPMVQLAEVQRGRCFRTEGYAVGDRGLHAVTEQPREHDDISLPRYLAWGDDAARRVGEASSAGRDAALIDYFKSRKAMGQVIHRFFGDPGLQVAAARYAAPEHQAAIAVLRQRIGDPSFASSLYAIAVTNDGSQDLTDPVVQDLQINFLPEVQSGGVDVGDTNQDGILNIGETWQFAGTQTITQAEIDNRSIGGIPTVDPGLTHDFTVRSLYDQGGPDVATSSVPIVQDPHVTLTKVATLSDGDTVADAAGEVIGYTIALTNDGNMDLTNPTVSDPSVSDLAPVLAGGFNAGDTNQDGELSVGETWQYTADHTVTQAEIDNGGVVAPGLTLSNTASAVTDQGASASATASVPVAQSPSLALVKAGTFIDANADGFANPGETISYTFTETNTGNMTLQQVAVSDQGSGVAVSGSPIASLAPGASDGTTYTGSYTITQADIDTGFKDNTAVATSDNATSAPATAHVVLPQLAHMTLSESASTPSNTPSAGDPLNYAFSVTNDGNLTLHDLAVSGTVAGVATLEQNGPNIVGDTNHNALFDVGETWMFTAIHALTTGDISGGVQDMATATALGPQNQMASAPSSFLFHT